MREWCFKPFTNGWVVVDDHCFTPPNTNGKVCWTAVKSTLKWQATGKRTRSSSKRTMSVVALLSVELRRLLKICGVSQSVIYILEILPIGDSQLVTTENRTVHEKHLLFQTDWRKPTGSSANSQITNGGNVTRRRALVSNKQDSFRPGKVWWLRYDLRETSIQIPRKSLNSF